MSKSEDPFITLKFKGLPVAKERARKGRHGFYTPEKTRKWELFAKRVASIAMKNISRFDGAIYLDMQIGFPVPVSWPEWKKDYAIHGLIRHTKKPDIDNVLKIVKDALNEIIYQDDSQAAIVTVSKFFTNEPMINVQIGRLSGAPCNLKTKKDVDEYIKKWNDKEASA